MKSIDTIKRFQQPGMVECGPAAVCAAISLYPDWMPKFSVGSITTAAGVTETIQNRGTTVAELAKGVEVLSDRQLKLLYKVSGTIDDIRALVDQGVPVVVDWQGSTLEGSDGNKGHFSLVIGVDDQTLRMVDSFPDFQELEQCLSIVLRNFGGIQIQFLISPERKELSRPTIFYLSSSPRQNRKT